MKKIDYKTPEKICAIISLPPFMLLDKTVYIGQKHGNVIGLFLKEQTQLDNPLGMMSMRRCVVAMKE